MNLSDLPLITQDLPKAKNIYDWVVNRNFLSWKSQRNLFPRQLGIAVNLFSEYCPYCSDVDYVKQFFNVNDSYDEIFNKVTLLEHDVCPKCGRHKVDLIREGKLKSIRELAGMAGQRSGKSMMVGIFSTYILHKLLTCDNIHEKLHLDPSATFTGTFVANNIKQTEESCWGYFKESFNSCYWLKEYIKRLMKIDKNLCKIGERSFEFKNKHIKFGVCASIPKTLRGSTRYFAVVDEIGWANDDKNAKQNADEIYQALSNSMATVSIAFDKYQLDSENLCCPLILVTSSPKSRTDKISTLINDINTYNKLEVNKNNLIGRLCYKLATWDINPEFPRDCEFIKSKYDDDPIAADRDFGCNPPMNSNAFFPEIKYSLIKNSFDEQRKNLITINKKETNNTTEYSYILNSEEWDKWINNKQSYKDKRIMALDLGYNNNSTAIVIGKLQGENIIIESANEIIPSKTNPIDFHKLQNTLLIPLIQKLRISTVICDKWQSLLLLQQIANQLRIQTLNYSLKYIDFLNIKNDLTNYRCFFPMLEDPELVVSCLSGNLDNYPMCFENKPNSHMLFQIFSVVDTHKKIEKGDKTTDDIFRAFSLLDYAIRNNEEKPKQIVEKPKLFCCGYSSNRFGRF